MARISPLRKAGFILIFCVVLVGVAEGLARLLTRTPPLPPGTAEMRLPDFDGPLTLWGGPYVFKGNPLHPHLKPYGMRDGPRVIPKPADITRVLVLGDSVTFGLYARKRETYAALMEEKYRSLGEKVEVINAGIPMYTPFNELMLYKADAHSFQPDIVVVQFCPNDVVDPILHWRELSERTFPNIPPEAFPNRPYHDQHVEELMKNYTLMNRPTPWLRPFRASRLFELGESTIERLFPPKFLREMKAQQWVNHDGRSWPVYLTSEDSKSISVLLDYGSPEWVWLRSTYSQLREAVTSDRAEVVHLFLPLAYQLEEGYPFQTSPVIAKYCQEAALTCLDMFPIFNASPNKAEVFFRKRFGEYDDIWHLSELGHRIVAEELAKVLKGVMAKRGAPTPGATEPAAP